MDNVLCSAQWQCELAASDMKGHGGWEKIVCEVFYDEGSGQVVPLICALKEGQIYEASGEKLKELLDRLYPVRTEGTVDAFREAGKHQR